MKNESSYIAPVQLAEHIGGGKNWEDKLVLAFSHQHSDNGLQLFGQTKQNHSLLYK